MPLNFPDTPAINQTYAYGARTWKWDGTVWGAVDTTGISLAAHIAASIAHGTTGNIVGTSDTQTLTNKTLTNPVITGSGGTLTLPAGPDTLVGRATTDTLTNKTLTSPSMTSPSVTDGLLTVGAGGASTATSEIILNGGTTTTGNGIGVEFKKNSVEKWRLYTPQADPNIYLRDTVNGVNQASFTPGAGVTGVNDFAGQLKQRGGKTVPAVTTSSSAPVSPLAGDIWLDTTTPVFTAPTLLYGWVDYGGFAPPGYYKDAMGFVHLQGLYKNGTQNQMFVLPAGYRPPGTHIFTVHTSGSTGRVDIDAGGGVYYTMGSVSYVSLSGITFATF